MIDSTGIQLRDSARAGLAMLMAQYEAVKGPIETLPIICGQDKVVLFSITPAANQAQDKNARLLRDLANKRGTANTVKKRQSARKIEILRQMAPTGAEIIDMCDATGLTPNTVMRYLKEHGIQLGRGGEG
ncbi:hypothetical protein M1D96_06325 [Pseudomonas sp. D1-3]